MPPAMENPQIPSGKSDPAKINRQWNDEDVLPPTLSVDTEFVFERMTVETLRAAQPENGARILDVGCGRAIDAASLSCKGSRLFGCEPSRVMLRKAGAWLAEKKAQVVLVGGIAEALPFAGGTFRRVVCKGAIDHFMDPGKAVAEMCRVARPDGRVVLSVANFESLSCRLGRQVDGLCRKIFGRPLAGPRIWETPADHTYKFDHASTLALARHNLSSISVRGVSLLWGFPRWPGFLKTLPRPAALTILTILDRIAGRFPSWSDVLVVSGKPLKKPSSWERKEKHG